MQVEYNARGFEIIDLKPGFLKQSSAIGDYDNSLDLPGSSFLWFYEEHLSREECQERLEKGKFESNLIPHIQAWLKTGSLIIT